MVHFTAAYFIIRNVTGGPVTITKPNGAGDINLNANGVTPPLRDHGPHIVNPIPAGIELFRVDRSEEGIVTITPAGGVGSSFQVIVQMN
jgi:hypothetical protein